MNHPQVGFIVVEKKSHGPMGSNPPPSGPSAPVQVAKAGDATYMALFESIFSYQRLIEGLLATVSYQY